MFIKQHCNKLLGYVKPILHRAVKKYATNNKYIGDLSLTNHYLVLLKKLGLTFCALAPAFTLAQAPDPAFLLQLSHSVAKVHVYNEHNQLGVGSSVVVAKNQVATNCHVIANANGIAINKLGNSYAPIGLKADWKHDLCILVFERLPLKPLALKHLNQQNSVETPIIAIGFSGSSPRPTRSYGHIKAFIPLDNSYLLQTSSGFTLGASGGALINYQGELLGLTTFKSPGRHGHYFSLSVDWISALLNDDVLSQTTEAEPPFWDTPVQQRPLFMQAVTHFQTKDWPALKAVAAEWHDHAPNIAEAWYYLGAAYAGLTNEEAAIYAFEQALKIAPNHSRSLFALGKLVYTHGDTMRFKKIGKQLERLNPSLAERYYHQQTQPKT